MSDPPVDPWKAEQRRLLKRIHKLTRRIRQLKSRHNALSPINRLPAEILLHIFFSVQGTCLTDSLKDYYGWTVLTHVSQYWRGLALSTKQLWNVLSFTTMSSDSPWIAESIKRSHVSDLDIHINYDLRGHNMDVLDCIPAQKDQMRALYVDITGITPFDEPDKFQMLFNVLVETTAPVLKKVQVMASHWRRWDSNLPPVTLFDAFAPCLTTLMVRDVDITFGSIPFRSLTWLELLYEQGDPGVISFSTLLDLLRITRLQTLKLYYALKDGPSSDGVSNWAGMTPISIPSLSLLELSLPAPQCVQFVSSVLIPQSCYSDIWGVLNSPAKSEGAESIIYTTPRTFFNTIFHYLSWDPIRFTGMQCYVRKEHICIGLRTPETMQLNGARLVHPTFEIASLFAGDATTFTLPKLAQFSNVSWVSLVDDNDPGPRPPPGLPEELLSRVAELSSLKELRLTIEFLTPVSNSLLNSASSFKNLSKITLRYTTVQPLEAFESFVLALSGWKEVCGKELDCVAVSGKEVSEEWLKSVLAPYLKKRLKDVVAKVVVIRNYFTIIS